MHHRLFFQIYSDRPYSTWLTLAVGRGGGGDFCVSYWLDCGCGKVTGGRGEDIDGRLTSEAPGFFISHLCWLPLLFPVSLCLLVAFSPQDVFPTGKLLQHRLPTHRMLNHHFLARAGGFPWTLFPRRPEGQGLAPLLYVILPYRYPRAWGWGLTLLCHCLAVKNVLLSPSPQGSGCSEEQMLAEKLCSVPHGVVTFLRKEREGGSRDLSPLGQSWNRSSPWTPSEKQG